ncbi:protein ripply2-like [Pristis pectinata]|uniref:protein ripply2-like n=1 Tax=Pristis pectinata TaxID=685728 RepID=UPI00223E29DD|nr:protein ripply2-like [Pristis pectinata]
MEVALLFVQNICYYPVQDLTLTETKPICENEASYSPPWRPWIMTSRDLERQRCRSQNSPHLAIGETLSSLFTHPVRLMWPKNKCFDYLYSEGQELLTAFPVQATISFYTESDSENEDEEFDEENELEEEPVIGEEHVGEKQIEKTTVVAGDILRHTDIIY